MQIFGNNGKDENEEQQSVDQFTVKLADLV